MDAVRQACRVTRHVQASLREDRDARTKADDSPVTVADYAAQAVVGHLLGEPFVGEEEAAPLGRDPDLRARVLRAARLVCRDLDDDGLLAAIRLGEGAPRDDGFWTLDPVDGTKGFLRGEHYCVSMARVVRGESELGVLGCPRLGVAPGTLDGAGVLLFAALGKGARAVPLDGGEEAVVRAEEPGAGAPVRIVESVEAAHTNHRLGPDLLDRAGLLPDEPLRLDSQAKYAVVARGDAHAFLRRPKPGYREKIWDHAGGARVALEAGCAVTDFDGRPLRFGDGKHLDPHRGILVAPPHVHASLLEALTTED